MLNNYNSDTMEPQSSTPSEPTYRLYKARFTGAIGFCALSIAAGLCLDWFGPIASSASSTFDISLDAVNWLGNSINCIFVVVAPFVPIFCSRYGLRISVITATVLLLVSAWIRFAGTALSLDARGAYALLVLGQACVSLIMEYHRLTSTSGSTSALLSGPFSLYQLFGGVTQVFFQVLAPKYSETWFDLKGRTTATMAMSVSFPVGNAIGQLISPFFSDVRRSILALAFISTAVAPCALLVGDKPPTPPSFSGSKPSPPVLTTVKAMLGLLPKPSDGSMPLRFRVPDDKRPMDTDNEKGDTSNVGNSSPNESKDISSIEWRVTVRDSDASLNFEENFESEAYMTLRERFDFLIILFEFSVLVSGVNTFSTLSNQILEPYGYSEDTAGLMGAVLFLSGLFTASVTSPLFDRVLTHHLGLVTRICCPVIAAGWLSLIWAVRTNNTGPLYAIFAVIGGGSVAMLPVGLELGCELTRNSDASAAMLWLCANAMTIISILVMSALRAPENANPPQNMHRSLIFNGALICAITFFIFFLKGRQRRRESDTLHTNEPRTVNSGVRGSSHDMGVAGVTAV